MSPPQDLKASELPGDADGSKIDLRGYWRTIRKRWPFVVLSMIVATVIAFVYTYRQPKIYEATCQVIIETMAPQVLPGSKDVVELGTGTYWANKEFYETQYRIIQSTSVGQRTAEKLGLQYDPDYAGLVGANHDLAALGRAVAAQLSIKPLKDSRLALITVDDRKPQRAALIANTVADTYIEYNLDYKLEGARSAMAWLAEQEAELKRQLEDSELKLYQYKKDRNLLAVSLDDKESMLSQNLANVNGKLTELHIKLLELDAKRKMIQRARENIGDEETLPEIRENQTIQKLRESYVQLSKDYADLSARYGPEYPKMKSLNGQMETIRKAYQQEIDAVLATFEKAYQELLDNERSLKALMEEQKKEAIELSKIEVEYKPLKRASEQDEKMYGIIASRQKEIDITGPMKTNNVRVLERAIVPTVPVRPRPVQNLLLGLLLGLGTGIGLAFAIEALDNTLKTQADVEQLLGTPVLGLVPIIGAAPGGEASQAGDNLRERDLGVFLDPKSVAAECCRSIRTNILFMSPDRPLKTMVVTSPSPQEGKTTTAINLGVTMAEAGGRVLIVDTDMRRPRLHRSFGVPNQTGISTVIVGKATLQEAVKRTDVPNLDVLTCGPVPPNPSELLHTDRFGIVLAECAKLYDRIILDSPPTSAVTDPAVLGNLADGVVLVVKAGETTREAATHARRQLATAKARLFGVVVNAIDFSNPAYGYEYYYRNYYRYGYTYGNGPDQKATS
ncbi:MAG TPA: polysaccharide biosynthesis tyrosine autokinase [Polyangia bacterium]|nr:polysaccharide biosynthesis tyrosine autokinase [Polyangia bacterium]